MSSLPELEGMDHSMEQGDNDQGDLNDQEDGDDDGDRAGHRAGVLTEVTWSEGKVSHLLSGY